MRQAISSVTFFERPIDERTFTTIGRSIPPAPHAVVPMIYAITALLVLQLLGEFIVHVFGLPLPGALVGMLLLFAGLTFHGSVPDALARTGGTLLQHLMLLLVPSVAGVMLHFGRVAREWQPFLIACVVGAAVTLVVTALTFQWMLKLQAKARR